MSLLLVVESLIYILPQAVCAYLHSNFSGGHRKTFLFLFGANRKRIWCQQIGKGKGERGERKWDGGEVVLVVQRFGVDT